MRILFVADIHMHIGKDPEFELNRINRLAEEINKTSPTIVVLLGDTLEFPRPNLETEKAFYDFITVIKAEQIFIIAGNHEELDKNFTTFDYLPEIGFKYLKDVTQFSINKDTTLWFVGHNRINELKDFKNRLQTKHNILASHIRCGMGRFVKEEIDFSKFVNLFDDIILGDIHYRYFPYPNTQYVSQPYRTAYTPPSDCGVVLLDCEKKSYTITYHPLHLPSKTLLEIPYSELESTLKSLNKEDLYKIRVSGTLEQLSKLPKVKDNIKLEPLVETEEVHEEDTVEEFKNKGKIDIVNTLKRLAAQTGGLSENALEKGEEILQEILKEYR